MIETACACPDHDCDCLCRYVGRQYGQLIDDPFAIWTFDTAILAPPDPNPDRIPEPEIVQDPNPDPCHRNIYHVSEKRADRVRKAIPLADVRLCINGACEPFRVERAIDLQVLRENLALNGDD